MNAADIRKMLVNDDYHLARRTTDECKIMNAVYDVLRTLTIQQIEKSMYLHMHKFAKGRERELFLHQCRETIRRKRAETWK